MKATFLSAAVAALLGGSATAAEFVVVNRCPPGYAVVNRCPCGAACPCAAPKAAVPAAAPAMLYMRDGRFVSEAEFRAAYAPAVQYAAPPGYTCGPTGCYPTGTVRGQR